MYAFSFLSALGFKWDNLTTVLIKKLNELILSSRWINFIKLSMLIKIFIRLDKLKLADMELWGTTNDDTYRKCFFYNKIDFYQVPMGGLTKKVRLSIFV